MNTKTIVAILILIIVVIAGAALIAWPSPENENQNGNGVSPQPFTSENVNVSSPLPTATVLKMFTVTGEARGTWYFEASFPLEVLDQNGVSIAMSHAEAQSDWMTTEFVPFMGQIAVQNYSGPATLVLHKDNPSGLPENEDSVSFSIVVQ